MDDRRYLDAKFDGLEKLMAVQESNLKGYIGAVSANVNTVRSELQKHKDSYDAHGVGQAKSSSSSIVAWIGLSLSAILAVVELGKMLR